MFKVIQADVEAIGRIDAITSILDLISHTTEMGFVAVARVTDESWVTCAVLDKIQFGLKPGDELKLETTICHEIRNHRQPVAIDHVAHDTIYSEHPTPAMYGFESYISVPIITKSGHFFGTLCAIDPKAAKVNTPEIISMFTLFADLIAFHLNALQELTVSEKKLSLSEDNNELKEHFIAILSHDLRNPVGAISSAAELMLKMKAEDPLKRLLTIIQNSVYRINGLINNTMDFASGRLGSGLTLNRDNHDSLSYTIQHVVSEIRLIYPNQLLIVTSSINGVINCDNKRIAQLLSNLLGNAIIHGAREKPVYIEASFEEGIFELSVINSGNQIPETTIKRLFQPFFRGNSENNKPGLGLGLYISSEIARAHGGTLEVFSSAEQTTFTLRIENCLKL
jgi:signal transduction histidine kinase